MAYAFLRAASPLLGTRLAAHCEKRVHMSVNAARRSAYATVGREVNEDVMASDLANFIRDPNDIMIIGFALLFFGVCQLFRKASS